MGKAAGYWSQSGLLMWKITKQKMRRKWTSLCECGCPIGFLLLLLWLRSLFKVTDVSDQYGYIRNQDNGFNFPLMGLNQTLCKSRIWDSEDADLEVTTVPSMIGVTPDTAETQDIMQKIGKTYWWQCHRFHSLMDFYGFTVNGNITCFTSDCDLNTHVKFFADNAAIETFVKADNYGKYPVLNDKNTRSLGAAIVFDDLSLPDIKYTLRFNESLLPPTDPTEAWNLYSQRQEGYPWAANQYKFGGFYALQQLVEFALIEKLGPFDGIWNETSVGDWTFPIPAYKSDEFSGMIEMILPTFLMIAFTVPFAIFSKNLVEEKQMIIKESIKIVGCNEPAYWSSWLFHHAIVTAFISMLWALVGIQIFPYSNPLLMFIFWWLFQMQIAPLAIIISSVFDSPKIAMILSFFLFFFLMNAGGFLQTDDGSEPSTSQRHLLCGFDGPACAGQAIDVLANYEQGGVGINWTTAYDEYNNFRFIDAIHFMALDFCWYLVFGLYLDAVFPSKYGNKKHPLFFVKFIWDAWQDRGKSKEEKNAEIEIERHYARGENDKIEELPEDSDLMVEVRNLKKTYVNYQTNQKVDAVKGIDLQMPTGQVFCLLGHNGAGKTTTISMLSGLIPTTSGMMRVMGKPISEVKEEIGICPQINILFPMMTTREHLQFYAALKGVPRSQQKEQVAKIAKEVDLESKLDALATNLSGGQKRKLSVGMAMIGDSKVIFLDEPSSGMDVEARRKIWNLIKEKKAGRCIILTTHFMDEADLLGDRIAIMAHGEVMCCGTSLFLKDTYGVGYEFIVSMNAKKATSTDDRAAKIRAEKKQEIVDTVMNILDGKRTGVNLMSSIGGEMHFRLPFETQKNFARLFNELDQRLVELHIETYGISVTTLDEVFQVIGHNNRGSTGVELERRNSLVKRSGSGVESDQVRRPSLEKFFETKPSKTGSAEGDIDFGDQEFQARGTRAAIEDVVEDRATGLELFALQWRVLFMKRAYAFKRSWLSYVFFLIVPILFSVLVVSLINDQTREEFDKIEFLDQPEFSQAKVLYNAFEASAAPANTQPNPYQADSTFLSNMKGPAPSTEAWSGVTYFNESWTEEEGGEGGLSTTTESNAIKTGTSLQRVILDSLTTDNIRYFGFFLPQYNRSTLVWDATAPTKIAIGFNKSYNHGLPAAHNLFSSALLAKKTGNNNAQIRLSHWPFPFTREQGQVRKFRWAWLGSQMILVAFCFLPMLTISNVMTEKLNLSKHQQLVCGADPLAYWLSAWVFDIIQMYLSVLICFAIIMPADTNEVFSGPAFVPTALTAFLFCYSIIPFTYLLTFFFQSTGMAQTMVFIFYFLVGIALLITSWVLDFVESTKEDNKYLKRYLYRIFPPFAMGENLQNIALRDFDIAFFRGNGDEWSMETSGIGFCWMAGMGTVYFILVLLVDNFRLDHMVTHFFAPNLARNPEWPDTDCTAERESLQKNPENYMIRVEGFRKVFGNILCRSKAFTAVKDIWFGVKPGEIFGFLGTNGAGKTTTLGMLTGVHKASAGRAFIDKIPHTNQIACRQKIGFCPQFDAIFDLLTAREHLVIYCSLKGITNPETREKMIETLITSLDLELWADKPAGTYSGGNKRKLSAAIALVGNPKVVILDEPSSGMDPKSKRSMWKFISTTMQDRSVILTTHSMEECLALCHRIGIMASGNLRCIGTPQHIQTRFGNGYELTIKLEQLDESVPGLSLEGLKSPEKNQRITGHIAKRANDIIAFFQSRPVIRAATLVERYDFNVKIKLVLANPQTSRLGMVFQEVEEAKKMFNIKNYSLSQTTLEQIFIEFARVPDWRLPPAQAQVAQPGMQVQFPGQQRNPVPAQQEQSGSQPGRTLLQPQSSAQSVPNHADATGN